MREFLGLAVILLVLGAPSAPALAQSDAGVRDPFVPLISPTVPDDGTTDPTVPIDGGGTAVQPDPTEPLPGTGSSAATWFGLAYVVIALGTGTLVLSKLYGPLRLTSR